MKRSEIDAAIDDAVRVLKQISFRLPPFADWSADDWAKAGAEAERIRVNGLGWDVSDYGSGDFEKMGGVLFTLRNGNYLHPGKGTPYAEKVIILKPGQRLPLHFHFQKMEDIINRGGGVLVMELYNSSADNSLDNSTPVTVFCDGIETRVDPGSTFELHPGQSITLVPRLFHRFWASKDGGTLVCGEVSTVNDDRSDNYFAEPTSRFAEIEEDAPARHVLFNEY